jgi:hypothetical protein
MYTVWHFDKHKITFKFTNDKFQKSLSRPSIIDARAHYWAAVRRLRSIALEQCCPTFLCTRHNSLMPMEVRAPPHYYYYYYYYYYHHHLIRTTPTTTNNNNVKTFNSTQTFKYVFCLKI